MNRLLVFLIWLLVLVGAACAFDWVMLHKTQQSPVLAETQNFYRDFRARLLALSGKRPAPPQKSDGVIEQHRTTPAAPATAPTPPPVRSAPPATRPPVAPRPDTTAKPAAATPPAAGYVYADAQGALHLATRLEEVPTRYRAAAQPLR